MRRYEMVFVADPTIPEVKHDALLTGLEELISARGGTIHKVDRWGRRKLAYPIKKHNEGNYTVMLVDAEPELEKEVLRRLKLSDSWLRYLSVRAEDQVPPTDEEKQALVEARREYIQRATEREAAGAAAEAEAEAQAAQAQDDSKTDGGDAAPAAEAAPKEPEAAQDDSEAAKPSGETQDEADSGEASAEGGAEEGKA